MSDSGTQIITMSMKFVTMFLVKEEKAVLIDTGIAGSFPIVRKTLETYGIEPHAVSLIIITHCHGDHTGDIARIREHTGARIAIHRSEGGLLEEGKNAEVRPVTLFGRIFSLFARSKPAAGAKPDILIDRELSLDEFGVHGKVLHTPGHTPGSVSVALGSGDVFIGDSLMRFNAKQAPKLPMFATDLEEVKKGISMLLSLSPKRFYLSHGGECTPEMIQKILEKK